MNLHIEFNFENVYVIHFQSESQRIFGENSVSVSIDQADPSLKNVTSIDYLDEKAEHRIIVVVEEEVINRHMKAAIEV